MIKSNLIAGLLVAIGIAFAGLFLSHALIKSRQYDRYVDVKGLAERNVKANQAIWQISFNNADDDLATLYKGIADSQNKIKDFLLTQGFQANDLEVQPVSVVDNQSYGYSSSNSQNKRYSANGGIIVNTAQVDKVQSVMQLTGSLVQQGVVVTNSNVNYVYNNLNDIKPEMLNEATMNAKLAAESFASNSHSQLGSIRSASQGLFTITDASGQGSGTSIMKKVRIVTSVEYYLQ